MSRRPAARVTSPRNPAARRLLGLERDRARRDAEGVYLAWGLHLLAEALAARAPIREAYAGPRLDDTAEGRALRVGLETAGVRPRAVATAVLDAAVRGSGDQGVLLVIGRTATGPEAILRPGARLAVALHGVQDPGNLGAIVRAACALGADGVLALEGCADPFGSRAVRAAMGAHFRLPVAAAPTAAVRRAAAAAGMRLVAADAAAGIEPARVDLTAPTLLLLGGEGGGLPETLLAAAAARVRIPMAGAASSLNVHAAAAVLLYEAARQRG
jgi:TrmH family RNA methyltransferase